MKNKTYTVTDPNGVLVGGKKIAKGQELPASAMGSQIAAFLRFEQIKATDAPEATQEPAEVAQETQEGSPKLVTATDYKKALDELGVDYKGNASLDVLKELHAEATA